MFVPNSLALVSRLQGENVSRTGMPDISEKRVQCASTPTLQMASNEQQVYWYKDALLTRARATRTRRRCPTRRTIPAESRSDARTARDLQTVP